MNDNTAIPVVIGAQVLDRDPVACSACTWTGAGWLSLLTIEAMLRSRLGERVVAASAEEMEAVQVALAAMLDMR